jgi:ubiquinone/menaquinone biosynthesis C-methylase UbiE
MDYKKINERFYSKSHWGLDRSQNKWFSKYVKVKILKKFMEKVDKRVLYDAGGGVGNYGWFFGKDFKKIIVSDISKIALSKIPEKNIKKLNCSVLDNKLPNNYADCILLIDVFEHIKKKDLPKMMKDLRRVLKPNGRILIFTSLFGWGVGAITQRIFNPKKRLLSKEYKEGHVNRLTFKEFQELFKKVNLKIENYYFYSIFFQQITDGIKDNFAKIISFLLNKKKEDFELGRLGQSVKEDLRKKETKLILKIPLFFLSYVSYLDILLFNRWFPGNSIFISLKK